MNIPEFSVSEFSRSIKRLVEDAFGYVRIKGEITGLKTHKSGHLYFSLQEDEAADFEDDDTSAFTDFMPEDEGEDMPIEEEAPDAPAIPTTGLMGRGV